LATAADQEFKLAHGIIKHYLRTNAENWASLARKCQKMVSLSKIGRGRSVAYHPPRSIIDEQVAELLGIHAGDGYYHAAFGVALQP